MFFQEGSGADTPVPQEGNLRCGKSKGILQELLFHCRRVLHSLCITTVHTGACGAFGILDPNL